MEPIERKTRQLAAMQIGDQVLMMCELTARIEQLTAQIEALQAELAKLKAERPEEIAGGPV